MFALIAFAALGANAKCSCACVNGKHVSVCSSSIDVPAICGSRICPITPPSVKPIDRPRVPPIGTKSCTNKQVYNREERKYEWKEICS